MSLFVENSFSLPFDRENRHGAGYMLLDRADTDAQTAGDFGVTEPVKSMHEENVACSGVGAFERLPHFHQTLLSGENLIGRGFEIGQVQIFHRLALVTVATGVAVIVDGEIVLSGGKPAKVNWDSFRGELTDIMAKAEADYAVLAKRNAPAVPYLLEAARNVNRAPLGLNRYAGGGVTDRD